MHKKYHVQRFLLVSRFNYIINCIQKSIHSTCFVLLIVLPDSISMNRGVFLKNEESTEYYKNHICMDVDSACSIHDDIYGSFRNHV